MLNNSDNEQSDYAQRVVTKDNSQSFSPEKLKDLSSGQPEDSELSEAALVQILGGPAGHNWFKLEQDGSKQKQLDRLT